MFLISKASKYDLGKLLLPEKILSLNYKKELDSIYQKLYYDNINYFMITNLFILSIFLTFASYIFAYPVLFSYTQSWLSGAWYLRFTILFISWFALNVVVYYACLFIYFFKLDSKFKKIEYEIEKDLPEFIDNLVSNLKGGISLEKALLQSVRKEQKAFLHEVTLINEKILMGLSAKDALHEFRKRFDSAIINRTFFLIEEGLKGGGNLVAPLERISENLKRIYSLDEEIKSNASGFAIIISAITIIVAPLLFSLAITLLNFISQLFILLSQSQSGFLPFVEVPEEFSTYLIIFSYAMIILITLFSSLIVAQLKNEKSFKVVKYLPFYIFIAIALYNIFSSFLLGFFGGIIS
jgi:pilus assembly protein TadC